jgi:hypothetical protein
MILPGEIPCAAANWQDHLVVVCRLFVGRYGTEDATDF